MSIVAPKGRKHLSADALFGLVRRSFATIADDRGGDVEIPFTEALMSAPIVQQDGPATNDAERHAATRFIATLRQDHPHLTCLVTEDRVRANAPHIETLHDDGCHAILGGKEGDHASVFTQVQTAEHAGRVTYDERHDRATVWGIGCAW